MLDAKSLMKGLQPLHALEIFLNWLNDQNVRKVLRIVTNADHGIISFKIFSILGQNLLRQIFT